MDLKSKAYTGLPQVFHFEASAELPFDLRDGSQVIVSDKHVVHVQSKERDA
jgi:hypothetical protein